jgi:hypothetical protein
MSKGDYEQLILVDILKRTTWTLLSNLIATFIVTATENVGEETSS